MSDFLKHVKAGCVTSKEMKMLTVWCFFVCAIFVIYAYLYNMIPFEQPVMWVSFISMAMFFALGADIKKIPGYAVMLIVGVLWGLLYYLLFEVLILPVGAFVAFGLALFIVAYVCLEIHWVLLRLTFLGSVTMLFVGWALCFSQNGTNNPALMITLLLGLVVGLVLMLFQPLACKIVGYDAKEQHPEDFEKEEQ